MQFVPEEGVLVHKGQVALETGVHPALILRDVLV